MNKRTFKIILVLIFGIVNGQTREGLLQKLEIDNYKSIEKFDAKDEVYKITNIISGRTTYKNLNNYVPKTVGNKNQVNTAKIYPDLVDTTQFTGMYEYWTSVPVGSFTPETIIVGDVNQNGKTELYGSRYRSYPRINERSMYEYNPDTKRFKYKTDMPWEGLESYGSFKQIYDVDQDGKPNVFITGNEPGSDTLAGIRVARILGINDSTNLPTEIIFDYKQWNQMNDPLWGEYDKREGSDLFYCGEGRDRRVVAARYDDNTNTTSTVYVYQIPEDIFYLAGLTNQDIDGDEYADLSTGGLRGDIVIFEYDENIQNYRDVWYGDGGTYNVYIHFNTNDIDKNGKKEIWVGGAAFYDEVPITRLSCLEAIGNNQYEAKHVIDIIGRFSFDAYNGFPVDIDNDGTEEIGLCLDQTFMLLKFTGEENEWSFELFYLKLNNFEQSEGVYFGATMYDINFDGFEELLIMTNRVFNNYQDHELKTKIYKPTALVSVEESELIVTSYNLYQNYPNPFNPKTIIEYSTPSNTHISLKVYDILGNEIAELVNELKSEGMHQVEFNAEKLPSGVYIYTIKANDYIKSNKMLLIK
ncbi:MAG: hypothetical protein CMF23_15335 [Ignavibacteriae bacterium]|nr:hypothetical protein [Ignavibacteriota bacterium]